MRTLKFYPGSPGVSSREPKQIEQRDELDGTDDSDRRWELIQQTASGRPATGPAPGGERVLAVSVPLFAAASSHWSSGSPHAPRLIAPDETFAGVDDDFRAKGLGLLAAFDLDVVMTSERESACYPTVPGIGIGIGIAQLSRREGIDAVLVTPWRRDGRALAEQQCPSLCIPEQAQAGEPRFSWGGSSRCRTPTCRGCAVCSAGPLLADLRAR